MVMAFLLAVLAMIPGDDAAEDARALIAVLRGDGDEERETARYRLTLLEPSVAPALRKMRVFQSDPGVKSALREAVPVLYGAWGWRLYREGRVEEALDRFAEAAEAPDPAKYVRAKLDDARGFIIRWMPWRSGCLPGSEHLDCSDNPGLIRSIKGCFGPWGMGAVLEGTRGDRYYGDQFWTILGQMGDEAVPVLTRELKSPDPSRRGEALCLMENMALRIRPRFRITREWVAAIRTVAEDPSETEYLRAKAEDLLQWFGGAVR
jgi:hypothetical protein